MKKVREDIVQNENSNLDEYGKLSQELESSLNWFKNQKIGVIFHWGLYAEAGIVESWQLSEEDDWARKKGSYKGYENIDDLREDYWGLNKKFNPQNFHPEEWAKQCKNAGFKYMLFTTKHHDGFNMYDTKFEDYKITNEESAFSSNERSDIFGEVAKAFQKENLSVGAYYSKPDWHSPFYWVEGQRPKGRFASYDPLENPEMWKKFNEYVLNQLKEICKNYAPIDILWLDGGWVNTENNEYLDMDKIVSELYQINKDLIIVDRAVGGDNENYVTPERSIPTVDNIPKKAWESNVPLAKNWGFVPNDIYKPFEEILKSVVEVVSLGGNILLGVGPKPDGKLPKEALQIMEKLGSWLKIYGEAIYDTSPLETTVLNNNSDYFFTTKEDFIYLIYSEENCDNEISLNDIKDLNVNECTIKDLYNNKELNEVNGILNVEKHNQLYNVLKIKKENK